MLRLVEPGCSPRSLQLQTLLAGAILLVLAFTIVVVVGALVDGLDARVVVHLRQLRQVGLLSWNVGEIGSWAVFGPGNLLDHILNVEVSQRCAIVREEILIGVVALEGSYPVPGGDG